MPHAKTKTKNSRTDPKNRANETDKDEEILPKKIIEIDASIILPELEEKIVDEEITVPGVEDEESEEVPTLDEEDVNPFGDKWEQ
jgi:hypothetical protein